MTSLRNLRINLHEEAQVDYLLRRLESLEELNGLAVERDALFNDDDEEEEMEGQVFDEGEIVPQQQDVTEEEHFEIANEYVHPSNVVLEESNEDGTLSVENYGQNGINSQSVVQQQTQI